MDAEQTRPLFAFFVVSLVAGLLLGQGIRGESFLDVFTGGPAGPPAASIASGVTLTALPPGRPVLAPPQPGVAASGVSRPAAQTAGAPAARTPQASRAAGTSGTDRSSTARPPAGDAAPGQAKKKTVKAKPTARERVSSSTRIGRTTAVEDTPPARGKTTRGSATRGKR